MCEKYFVETFTLLSMLVIGGLGSVSGAITGAAMGLLLFIADDGHVLELADMQPFDDTTRHCSRAEARFALEMHQGWFARRGIAPGFRLRGQPFEP